MLTGVCDKNLLIILKILTIRKDKMSLNHIVKNGLKDVSLDVKDLNCTSITVNNAPIESFNQDLNTTSDVRFNKISVTSTMFTDPDQVVSKQYVDN